MSKSSIAIMLIFFVIIGTCLSSIFMPTLRISYIEKDNQPGYTEGDTLLTGTNLFDVESVVTYPNYFLGLCVSLMAGTAGLVLIITKLDREKGK